MFRTLALAAGLVVSAGASPAQAWGCDAHQAIAIVAERLLGAATLAKVSAALGASPVDPALSRFCHPVPSNVLADVASWADDSRDADPSTAGWHFINFPRAIGGRTDTYRPYCPAGNCVVDAIVSQYRTLTTSSDPVLKANALRFIVHLVGDVHQPLHTITNGDRGGNCLPVTDGGQSPQEDDRQNWRPNLHGVWDAQMIRRMMEARGLADSRALADFIAKNPRPAIRNPQSAMRRPAASRSAAPSRSHAGGVLRVSAKVPTTARVKEWARESNALGRSVAYGRLPVRLPLESAAASTPASCDDHNHVGRRMAALNERITEGYEQASVTVIVSQLRLAAERLASVLRSAFP